ncbi:MAG: hypothetical protein JWO03_524 [Bacteroidetes bacterium]|nr:hypothetical protein [Bacteroidota bacterium]
MRDFTARYKFFDAIINMNAFGTRKLAKYLSYMLIPKPNGMETIKTMLGFTINAEPVKDINGLEHELYYKGTYEKATMHVIKSCLSEGDTFIDVGANIGVVSLYASICVGNSGKVIAYEANPDTVKLLKNNIALNKFTNIAICEYALGSQEGKGEIYPETVENNRGAASMVRREGQGTLKYDISIKKLDDTIGDIKPKMMKADVEGWELEVLKGAKNVLSGPDAPILIVECFMDRENTIGSPSEIFKYIKSVNDYVIYRSDMGKDRLSKLVEVKTADELPDQDNIVCITRSMLPSIPKSLLK